MQASKNILIRDVIGRSGVIFTIPVYQRNYSWNTTHTAHLLSDIETILETGATKRHFLGSIVVLQEEGQAFSVQRYTLIDGQQRVTTFMLLLLAIAEEYAELHDRIWQEYLHNNYCDNPAERVKLHPLNDDATQFLALLNHKQELLNDNSLMVRNYRLCKQRLERWHSKYDAQQIWNCLHMLEVVTITLKLGEDDPQEIFESINSTGLPLSKADLIRNFLLMGESEQQRLYADYWAPMEKRLAAVADKEGPDDFFFAYLQSRSGAVINKERLYQHFTAYYRELQEQRNLSKESLLRQLSDAARLYESFLCPTQLYTPGIRRLLQSLRSLEQATIYPFLFRLFQDYEAGSLPAQTLEGALELVLAYLVRRMVCGVPSNSLKGFFCTLYERVFRIEANRRRCCEALNKFLFTRTSRDKFPDEAEFLERLEQVDLYHNARLCRLLMAELENGGSKEHVLLDNMTIEHIMPQTLNKEWAHISMEDHRAYLHTLGNLTLTAQNAELSNRSFADKKEMLQNSKAVLLNKDVLAKESWGIEDIRQRAKRLARLVNERFCVRPVRDPHIIFEPLDTVTLDRPELATKSKIVSYIFRGEERPCTNYMILIRELIQRLDREQPEKLQDLIAHAKDKSVRGLKVIYQQGQEGMWAPMNVRDDVYADTHGSSATVVRKIRYLFARYNVPESELTIRIRPREDHA